MADLVDEEIGVGLDFDKGVVGKGGADNDGGRAVAPAEIQRVDLKDKGRGDALGG